MNIVGIAGIALVSAVIAVMLRRYNQEYAVVVTITAGVIILVQILANIMPAIRQINSLLSSAGLPNEYAVILFKTLGLCFLAQFSADSCRDAGENALASKVELAGKLAIVILALPLFEKITSTALALIGGGS